MGERYMTVEVIKGILIPFLGTSAGAGCVFFMRGKIHPLVQRALIGFASGVMVAASIWSLLIPAMEQVASEGIAKVIPAVAGFWFGILFLLLLDHVIPHLHMNSEEAEGPERARTKLQRTTMLVLAVTIHNIPEGMAVGVVYAGWMSGETSITALGALALSVGISLPLKAEGMKKGKAFVYGVLSGAVEPIGAFLTILAAGLIIPALPYLLSFAAGAMMYVVVEELIPEMSEEPHSDIGTLLFAFGFTLMLALDVVLG